MGDVINSEHGSDAECRIRTDGGDTGSEQTVVDRLLGILAAQRRRYALYYLREHDVATVDELARLVSEELEDASASTDTDDRVDETRLALRHVDLPKLTAVGIVEYDYRSETVRYRQPSARFATLLESCAEIERNPFAAD
ncbi:DUF7344 domain-containing protein [Natronorubrum sp. FCH18a]|uniref:DUF7344 domain-containing protein n=1 Tax=Natronorubrum sp. FCH18a TaxID=3447018 RepID=UPI003F5135C4